MGTPQAATAERSAGVVVEWLGHAAFALTAGDVTVLVDPYLSANPVATARPEDFTPSAVLVTHGHVDHLGDTVAIARRAGAPVVAIHELGKELAGEGLDVRSGNLGGTLGFDWGWVRLVPALHTAVSPNGTPHGPAGLVISIGGVVVYHLGDTCLFSDMALVSRRTPVDVALICIGGHFTMDRHDAVEAVKLIAPTTVIPCHYDTQPLIRTDAQAFRRDVEACTAAACLVLEPGGSARFAPSTTVG